MNNTLTPEQRLAVEFTCRALGHASMLRPGTPVDWELFEAQVTQQGLAPVVQAGLELSDVDVPLNLRAWLRMNYAVAGFRTKTIFEPALAQSLDVLTGAGLKPIVLKGAALAYLVYPKPEYRTLADIDLLLPADELARADEVLVRHGFRRHENPVPHGHHHLPPYVTPNGQMYVEIHHRLVDEECPYSIDTKLFADRAHARQLSSVATHVLAPHDALLHVSVHLAYGHRYQWFPLRSLIDILAIVQSDPAPDWELLIETARDSGMAGAAYWPLRFSKEWLGAAVPAEVVGQLSPRAASRRIFEAVLTPGYVIEGQRPAGAGSEVLYDAMRELSLFSGCSLAVQIKSLFFSLFPTPDSVGHLPGHMKRSRLRYSAYLSRPLRLGRGIVALTQLLMKLPQPREQQPANTRGSVPSTHNQEDTGMPREIQKRTRGGAVEQFAEPLTLSVVVPALNEEDGIAAIIERIEAIRAPLAEAGVDRLEIIVVDDGSRDRTPDIVLSYPNVRLIRHPRNRGYGAAIKTGFNAALGQLLAFTDADGTYPPERFPSLCRTALEQEADVVVGSRRSGERSEMPPMRRVGNFIWSNLVSVIGNHRVADPASGMRVLWAEALPKLYPLPDGLNFTPVMSTRCVHENLNVIEVAIPYTERVGRSKLSIVKDGSRFLKTILWTSLEYNPVRVLGLAGVTALALAAAIGIGIVSLRLQGVTQLREWGTFSVFAALVLGVAGVSIFSLGAMFNYLVSLFRREPVRKGLFGKPLFRTPLDRHFGWMGLIAAISGIGLAIASLALTLSGMWDSTRLSLWLLGSALFVLVGLQLVVSWIVMRVLETLSMRDVLIEQEMRPVEQSIPASTALVGTSVAN